MQGLPLSCGSTVLRKYQVLRCDHPSNCASSCFQENPTLKDTLSNPIIDDDKKKTMLSTIASEAGFTEHTLSFLNLLVDARRADTLDEIVEAFETKYCSLTDTQVTFLDPYFASIIAPLVGFPR